MKANANSSDGHPLFCVERHKFSKSRNNLDYPENRGAADRPHPYFRAFFKFCDLLSLGIGESYLLKPGPWRTHPDAERISWRARNRTKIPGRARHTSAR
jgi:hypothetical protein